ncbi:contact-dependent growth inhibition system immunity protein [Streptomyces sp. NPDC005408]|uniref:contact-dependent growth inhibition system immunity protein n=1 Tax=Streptomyces sp. NPDC005408 TaxID=3155341 RepID=UPI0033B981B4
MNRLLHRDRTLEDLEDSRWPDPGPTTSLAERVHALRRKPIGTLTVEDLRTLIVQSVGLPFLLPLAVEVLLNNPLVEGKFYEGDLLSAVTTRDPGSWSMFPDLARELGTVVSRLTDLPNELHRDATSFLTTVGHA